MSVGMYSTKRFAPKLAEGYLNLGDPYDKTVHERKDPALAQDKSSWTRSTGKNFSFTVPKKGQTEGYFGKMEYVPDTYQEQIMYNTNNDNRPKAFGTGDAHRRDEFAMHIRAEQYRETMRKETRLAAARNVVPPHLASSLLTQTATEIAFQNLSQGKGAGAPPNPNSNSNSNSNPNSHSNTNAPSSATSLPSPTRNSASPGPTSRPSTGSSPFSSSVSSLAGRPISPSSTDNKLPDIHFQAHVPQYLYDVGKPGPGTTPICHKCKKETFYCKHRVMGPDLSATARRVGPLKTINSQYGYGVEQVAVKPTHGIRSSVKEFHSDNFHLAVVNVGK